jgi:eukaryotic-like serine/threonine-protein kinase
MPSSPPYPNGTVFNARYTVQSFLGQGAAGAVYQVLDAHMDTEVALKILPPIQGQPAAWNEAQILEQLRGDYLLPVYNADVISGTDIRFITTKVMNGGDLESECKPYGSEIGLALRWCSQISHAAERLHSAGLLHRDIKPGNCFLDDASSAHLADLGMAVTVDINGRTDPNGTLATVAPEALSGTSPHCTVASDIYSLGATAFYLIAGTYPVRDEGKGRAWYRDQVVAGNLQRLRDVAPHATKGLATVVERALSKDPAARQPSALDFANQVSSATRHDRQWRRVEHPGHTMCLEAPGDKKRQGVEVCAFPSSAGFSIEARSTGGRRIRRYCYTSVRVDDIPKEMRRIASNA